MRYLFVIAVFLTAAVILGAAAENATVTYVSHDQVSKAATIVAKPEYSVQNNRRTSAGQVEVHTKATDIFHVIEGEATLVTGGTVVGGKTTEPNQIR